MILQTPLIIDGLRRCSSSNSSSSSPTDGGGGGGRGGTKKEKPGRELVTFLVICNLSVWIMETFEMSQSTSSRSHHQSDRIHFYGNKSTMRQHNTESIIDGLMMMMAYGLCRSLAVDGAEPLVFSTDAVLSIPLGLVFSRHLDVGLRRRRAKSGRSCPTLLVLLLLLLLHF